jgi:protein TonB
VNLILSALALAVLSSVDGQQQSSPTPLPQTDQVSQDSVIKGAQFDALPNVDQFIAAYPPHAQALRMDGYIKLRCTVKEDGYLKDCTVASEKPLGYGFGDAALKLSSAYKLKPLTAQGAPVAGGTFLTNIHFTLRAGP